MKTIGMIQARMGSTRLPGKVMMPLDGKPMLWHVAERCKQAESLDMIVVATTTKPKDEEIVNYCAWHGINCHKGSELDVLERYYECAKHYEADVVVRITADCPLVSPEGIDEAVDVLTARELNYVQPPLWRAPPGIAIEVMTFSGLECANKYATKREREHVTTYLKDGEQIEYRSKVIPNRPDLRLTVDELDDYKMMAIVYANLYKPGEVINLYDVVKFLDDNPNIKKINQHVEQVKP